MELAAILRDAARAEILPRFRRLDAGMVQHQDRGDRPRDRGRYRDREGDQGAHRRSGCRRRCSSARNRSRPIRRCSARLADGRSRRRGRSDRRHRQLRRRPAALCLMAAVVSGGETVAGIIYDPMGDDWIMAEKGGGAWLRRPDGEAVRLQVGRAAAAAGDGRHGLGRLHARRHRGRSAAEYRQGAAGLELPLRRPRIPHLRLRPRASSSATTS